MDTEDGSLAHIGHTIFALLDEIATFQTDHLDDSKARTLGLIINESDRFKIWSSSMGLLIPGHGSLDYRVREAETISNTFRSFLSDLRENFEEVLTLGLQDDSTGRHEDSTVGDGYKEDDDGDDGDDSDETDIMGSLLEAIKEIIDRLFRLAIKLRSPETRLRSSKAQSFQMLDDGVDLFERFYKFEYDFVSSLFRQYRSDPKLINDDEIAVVPHQNPRLQAGGEASQYLIERIVWANVARRRQFAYWKHHRLKLEQHTETALAARKVTELTKVSGNPPTKLLPINSTRAMTVSTATQLAQPAGDFDDLVSMVSVSEYLPSSGEGHNNVVNFPPPPRVAANSKFFECPYCFTTCNRRTSRVKAWQAHLIHDLRPYICTYKNCRTPSQIYDSKADWIQHEITSHAMKWECPVHPDEAFDSLVAFQLHMTDGHAGNVMTERSAQKSEVILSMDKTNRPCPICNVSSLSMPQLSDHIATHLERISVFSLPKHADMAEANNDDRGSNEANGEEDSRGLDLDSHLSFESAPTSSVEEYHPLERSTRPQTPSEPEEAEQVYLQELAEKKESLGADHISTLDTVRKLGELYDSRDNFELAAHMFRRLLAGREKELGLDHSLTIDAAERLGHVHFCLGEYEPAEQIFRRVLAGRHRTLESGDSFILSVTSRLVSALIVQGKLTEAEQLCSTETETWEKLRGEDHLSTLASKQELADVLNTVGRYPEAEDLYGVVSKGVENSLGEDHIKTLEIMSELGKVLETQNKYSEAEMIHRKILGREIRVLGEDSEEVVSRKSRIVTMLQEQERYSEAAELQRTIVESQKRMLGEEHPTTLNSMHSLGVALFDLSKFSEAEQLYRTVLAARQTALNEGHHDRLASMKSLAYILSWQYKYPEAEELLCAELKVRERDYGEEHVATQESMRRLADVLSRQRKFSEAEEVLRREIEVRKRVLGEENPDTQYNIAILIGVLEQQKKWEEAEELLREEVKTRKRVQGEEHYDTLYSISCLGNVLRQQGKFSEAEEVLRKEVEVRKRVQGKEYALTLSSMRSLANVLSQQRKFSEAEAVLREELEVRKRSAQGEEDLDTQIVMDHLAVVLREQGKFSEATEMNRSMGKRKRKVGYARVDTEISAAEMEEGRSRPFENPDTEQGMDDTITENSDVPLIRTGDQSNKLLTDEDWESRRDVITKLYTRMTLESVMQVMNESYNFHASKQMYLRHIKKWGIMKNFKASEKEAVASRVSDGSRSVPLSQARLIPVHQVVGDLEASEKKARAPNEGHSEE